MAKEAVNQSPWSKTKAEFVVDVMHEHFGPKSSWELKTFPDHKGTERRREFDRLVELLSELMAASRTV